MRSSDRERADREGTDRYSGLAQIILSVTSAIALLLAVTDRFATDQTALFDFVIGAAVVVYFAGAFWLLRRLRQLRYYDFRIALTGQPKAGKTVFASLLYDHLMNATDSRYAFTAESRSAIATYQAIRGMSQDIWPASTTTGAVLQRDGTLRYRRTAVDLEIGDSAGQHWLQLTEGESSREADYLQWVLSAHAVVHVIPADRILTEGFDAALRADVEDLRLAAQLMRSVSGGKHEPVPILVVISKMDLIPAPLITGDMMRIFAGAASGQLESTRVLTELGQRDLAELLDSLSKELSRDYRSVFFIYSSAETAQGLRTLGTEPRDDVPAWVIENAVTRSKTALHRVLAGAR